MLTGIKYLGLSKIRNVLLKWNSVKQPRPPIRPEFRAELIEVFKKDIEELSNMLGRDLQHWILLQKDLR